MRNFEVKLSRKLVLVLALVACFISANLNAQTSSVPATGSAQVATAPAQGGSAAVVAAPEKAGEEAVPASAPAVFHVLGLPVTNSMICTWIVGAIILIVVRVTTWRNIKEIPSGMQNFLEALVEMWDNLIGDILDKRVTRWVFPFATTFFIFIVISNLSDLVPGVGSIGYYSPDKTQFTPLFRPPTTDANLTVVMATIFLFMSLFWAVRYNGFFGLIKHIFGVKMEANKWVYPLFFLLFLFIGAMELLSVMFARPVALAMRLYGNIFAGESILDMIFHSKSLVVAIFLSTFMYFYETFVCLVQAFVFAMLVVAFVGTLCTHTDEQHGH
ncbi:MAG TPA: F0F1 ATP synthase subunit A [Verrucomicrobiae bacterium]|nr:F0F1 ATP synthase subunit A [Verrucomicrobiae bacterium]